jgi:hypothetical protein
VSGLAVWIFGCSDDCLPELSDVESSSVWPSLGRRAAETLAAGGPVMATTSVVVDGAGGMKETTPLLCPVDEMLLLGFL